MGDISFRGLFGQPIDHDEALRWLRKSAEADYFPAKGPMFEILVERAGGGIPPMPQHRD